MTKLNIEAACKIIDADMDNFGEDFGDSLKKVLKALVDEAVPMEPMDTLSIGDGIRIKTLSGNHRGVSLYTPSFVQFFDVGKDLVGTIRSLHGSFHDFGNCVAVDFPAFTGGHNCDGVLFQRGHGQWVAIRDLEKI